MEVTSTSKYVRISPQKAREVAREIQGRSVSEALDILAYSPKKASFLINKTLGTAMADAANNYSLDPDDMVVKEAVVGAAPTLKRFKPRARGSAGAILKRSSHIKITLAELEDEPSAKPKPVHVSPKPEA